MTTWRYQPVWIAVSGERKFRLVEVHFEDDGVTLHAWGADPVESPTGDTAVDLALTLTMMLRDALRWEPVAYELLHAGMVFAERTD